VSSEITFAFGLLAVVSGGLLSGSAVWPMKLMKRYQFEHWWFIGMLTALLVLPWTITLLGCPHVMKAYGEVPLRTLVTANLWSVGWGVANVLCGLCYVRLGMALTAAIITGLGSAVGVLLPLMVKGSGVFKEAGNLNSSVGLTLLSGVGIMLIAVVCASLAGAGRDRGKPLENRNSGSFAAALLMALVAGILSAGMGLSFVYGQGPIIEAMKREGAGEIPANFAVWSAGLLGGAFVSVLYPAWLMCRKKNWHLLTASKSEFLLAILIGLNGCAAAFLMGFGMRMLGALGASVGLGIQSASWMLGGQIVGFVSGEWRGVSGPARTKMYLAVACLIAAILIMMVGNSLGNGAALSHIPPTDAP